MTIKLIISKTLILSIAFTGLMATTYLMARTYTPPERVTINLPDPPRPLPDPPQPEPVEFQE